MKFQTTHKEKKKNKNKEFDGKYRICRDEKEEFGYAPVIIRSIFPVFLMDICHVAI
jgi:hypothetical protein